MYLLHGTIVYYTAAAATLPSQMPNTTMATTESAPTTTGITDTEGAMLLVEILKVETLLIESHMLLGCCIMTSLSVLLG